MTFKISHETSSFFKDYFASTPARRMLVETTCWTAGKVRRELDFGIVQAEGCAIVTI